ncbi:MAG: VWA domain-containing protein, partial [Planctomycetes bacterium]|nr:VWA domain-containing protein [Planctomycetota bacterium]
AIKNNDKVGLILFTDRVEKFVPPRKGTKHVLRVIRELLAYQPEGRGTNIALAMEHLNRIMRRKAVVFLISDFQDSRYEKPLKITRQSHDLILIAVNDRREQEIPNLGLIELEDGETQRRIVVDTSSARWRRKYQRLIAEFIERRDGILRRSKLDVIHINTGESFVEPLTRFFRRRELRR